MTIYNVRWEEQLINKATRAISKKSIPPLTSDGADLALAYEYCARITRLNSRTFYLTSGLLNTEMQKAVRALYAFSRISDDTVDRSDGDLLQKLEEWSQESLQEQPPAHAPVPLAWADTRSRYKIPIRLAEQLFDGIAQDITKKRYHTFHELAFYCYGVASTVGLMTMHIIGYKSEAAIPYAIKLGVALQLTNILRDVREDWENGRLYLPLDELKAYGLSEADIDAGINDDRWKSFMRFQIDRARRLYCESLPGIALLGKPGRFAILAAAKLYQAILKDIERHNYDVFTRRAYVSGWGKLRRLPGLWWQANFGFGSKVRTIGD